MINHVHCLHPRIILNPAFYELVARHGNYTIRNKTHRILTHKFSTLYEKKFKKINPHSLHITPDDFSSCYITDCVSHEHYPIYLEVRCGRCSVCKESKVTSFVQRCKLESLSYNCLPIFLTLTYREEKLPKNGVSVDDAQRFFKRLRENLRRRGYRDRLRYALVSEYGKKGRAHYHAIIWNLHETSAVSYAEITQILAKSWSCGFSMCRLIDLKDDRAFYYTAKYLRKNRPLPCGCNPTFLLSSNRNGGIGRAFLDRSRPQIVRRLDTSYQFVNHFSGKVEKLNFDSYVLGVVFPSSSKIVPSSVRNAARDFVFYYNLLSDEKKVSFKKTHDEVVPALSSVMWLPFNVSSQDVAPSLSCVSVAFSLSRLIHSERVLCSFLPKIERCSKALSNLSKREKFLEKLFQNVEQVDLNYRAYKTINRSAMALEREIL